MRRRPTIRPFLLLGLIHLGAHAAVAPVDKAAIGLRDLCGSCFCVQTWAWGSDGLRSCSENVKSKKGLRIRYMGRPVGSETTRFGPSSWRHNPGGKAAGSSGCSGDQIIALNRRAASLERRLTSSPD